MIGTSLKPHLFDQSVLISASMQQFARQKAPWLPYVLKLFGDLGDGKPYFIASLLLAATGRHYEFNTFLATFLFALIFNHVLKLLIMHPRPYFINRYIASNELLDCSAEFGNPSGHSVMAAAIFFYARHTLFKAGFKNLIFTIFMVGTIGLSRLFGGMHTLD